MSSRLCCVEDPEFEIRLVQEIHFFPETSEIFVGSTQSSSQYIIYFVPEGKVAAACSSPPISIPIGD